MSSGILSSPFIENSQHSSSLDWSVPKKETQPNFSALLLLPPQAKRTAQDQPDESQGAKKIKRLPSLDMIIEEEAPSTFKLHLSQSQENIPDPPLPEARPLTVRLNAADSIGQRRWMEDAHFHTTVRKVGSLEQLGWLIGVFDGHGAKGFVARQTAQIFQDDFPTLIQAHPGEEEEIFKQICSTAHEMAPTIDGGTTALVSYFETATGRLSTATLGDSRCTLFRKIGDTITHESLSAETHWGMPEEAERVRAAFQDDALFEKWTHFPNKLRYFPHYPLFRSIPWGVNVSRTIGDKRMVYDGRAATSQIPTFKCIELLPDSSEERLVVWACDGLWDFVTPEQLIEKVLLPHWNQQGIAQTIVDYALETSTDNVTVICAWVEEDVPQPPTQPCSEEERDVEPSPNEGIRVMASIPNPSLP